MNPAPQKDGIDAASQEVDQSVSELGDQAISFWKLCSKPKMDRDNFKWFGIGQPPNDVANGFQ